ncbi:MAG: TonB-dependent receptor domain-containing protein [Terriglobia bacterium]
MRKFSTWLWVACVFLLPAVGFSQGDRGALTGVVTDPTGAVVPEATVTITETRTGVVTTVASSSAGYYRVPVSPGTYKLEAAKEGFKTAVADKIVVPVAQVVTIDFTLQIGSRAESVTVTSEAPLLTPSTAEVGNNLTPQEFATLPIAVDDGGRQLMTFIYASLPGAVGDSWAGSINGAQFFSTDIMIEGLPVARFDLQGSISEATPSADTASEFKVQTSSYSAEYGATAGGIANFSMKSGTNDFHGSAYEYLVNPSLNAMPWQTNALPEGSLTKLKPPVRENNYGFVIGGPIRKNKTFFFFNYEGDRRRAASPNRYITVPTSSMLKGDFSQWLYDADGNLLSAGTDALGRPVYWYEIFDPTSSRLVLDGATDPISGLPNNSGSDAVIRDGFGFDPVTGLPGTSANIIPSQYFSVASADLLPEFPSTINSQLGNNLVGYSGHPKLDIDKFSIKIDHNFNDRHKMSGFWTLSSRERLMGRSPYWLPLPGYPIDPTKIQSIPFRLLRVSEDWTINDHTINHFSVGYNRFGNFNGQPAADVAGFLPSELGITGVPDTKIPQMNMSSFSPPSGSPARGKQNLYPLFGSWQRGIDFNASESYIYSDTLSHVRGKHSFKFGVEYRRYRMNDRPTEGSSFNFSYLQTAMPGGLRTRTGHPFASFILGATNGGSRDVITTSSGYRDSLFSLYAQDDWKATSKLTVSYGLRWEVPGLRTEAFDRISGFDPAMANPGADGMLGALAFLGDCTGCDGRSSFQERYYRQFAPRLGLAYQATQKLVVRAGYGISYAPPIANGWPGPAVGYNDSVPFGNTGLYPRQFRNSADPANYWTQLSGATIPAYYVDSGRVGVPAYQGTLPNTDPTLLNLQGIDYTPPSTAQPYIQNWNIGFQYMLPSEILFEADYVGSKGTRLIAGGFAPVSNRPSSRYMGISGLGDYLTWDLGEALDDPDAAAALAQFGITGLPFADFGGTVSDSLRPYPQYTDIYDRMANYGNSTYHSLQTTVRRRVGNGLNFIAAYTWSKTLTNADSALYTNYIYYWQNFDNQRGEKSIAQFDYRHNFKLTWIYDLPFGKGGKWLANSGALDKIVGGWRISAIQNYRSGNPLMIYNSSLDSGLGQWGVRGDVIPGIDQKVGFQGPLDSENGNQYLNPDAFNSGPYYDNADLWGPRPDPVSNSVATRWGSAPRFLPSTRGPGFQSEDFALLKDTRITERFILKFRADFFNVFNRTGLGNPNTDVGDPGSFGKIYGVAHGPRNIMLSLRLDF